MVVMLVTMVTVLIVTAGVCSRILGARVKADTLEGSFLLPMPSTSPSLWRQVLSHFTGPEGVAEAPEWGSILRWHLCTVLRATVRSGFMADSVSLREKLWEPSGRQRQALTK